MRIKLVTFDADQTLWDFHTVRRKALTEVVHEVERRTGAVGLSVDAWQAIRDEIAEGERGTVHSLEDVRRRSFAVALRRCGLVASDALCDELLETFLRIRHGSIELFPDARPCLQDLRKSGCRLGVITNGNTSAELSGLSGVFDFVIAGPDIGLEKPDPAMFRKAEHLSGVGPSESVHVGDERDDVEGSMQAGWRSILLDRDGRKSDLARIATWNVMSLSEVPPLLTALRDGRLEDV